MEADNNPIEAWPKAVYEQPFFQRGNARQMFLYAADPSMLKDILLDKADAFPKDWMFDRVTKPALGGAHRPGRALALAAPRRRAWPARHRRGHDASMVAAAEAALARWRDMGEARAPTSPPR